MSLLYHNKLHPTGMLQKYTEVEEKLKFDPTTYKHCLNVANYAVLFLESTLTNVNKDLMYYCGLLHDIGKCKVDTCILNKNGPLTKEQYKNISKHTSLGYSLLLKMGFPTEILVSAQLHHERYDGTGYPLGLKGDDIPLISRIISICDVFDALTSDRPYREAHSVDKAFYIMNNSFGQFDPELLDCFITKFREYFKNPI